MRKLFWHHKWHKKKFEFEFMAKKQRQTQFQSAKIKFFLKFRVKIIKPDKIIKIFYNLIWPRKIPLSLFLK